MEFFNECSNGLGVYSVKGSIRVPFPAARITALTAIKEILLEVFQGLIFESLQYLVVHNLLRNKLL